MDGSIDALLDVDPARIDHDGRLDLLADLEQARAALDAQAQRTLAALAREGDAEQRAREWVREEVAAALRIAPATAGVRLHDASELVQRLPRTLDRLVDGSLTLAHARVVLDATRRLDDRVAAQVETRVLRRAGEQTIGEFRQAVRRAVLATDPAGAEQRHRDAVTERRVTHTPEDDGMAWIGAYLRADDAAHLYTTLDALAAGLTDDRTADQKRADVLAELHALEPSPPTPPAPGGGWSPTPSAGSSTTARPPTGHRPGCATTCSPNTPPAPSPAAAAPPGAARPIT